jgi:hypothetical protein
MADPMVLVPTPTRPARKGGIKSIVDGFVTTARLGAAANVQYLSEGCGFPSVAPGLCWGTVTTGDKTADGISVTNGISSIFAQYAGVECFLDVRSSSDYAERARLILERGEDSEIEANLVGWADAGAVEGTGAGITNAIAAAEEWADQKYIGLPVIIMSRSLAVKAAAEGSIDGNHESGKAWTINGTPILATWTAPEDKIFVIGWPTIYASEFLVNTARDLTTNVEMAIAERLYGIAVDCSFRAEITVTAPVAADPQEPDPDEPLEMNLGSIPSSPIPDGRDTTIIVQTNVTPQNEVVLWYAVNGGAPVEAGEMTETGSHEYVWNVIGDSTTTGDSVEVWAVSEFDSAPVESNHIIVEVT